MGQLEALESGREAETEKKGLNGQILNFQSLFRMIVRIG